MDKKGWRYDKSKKKCQVTNIVLTDCDDKNVWNNGDELLCVKACEGKAAFGASVAEQIQKDMTLYSW